MTVAYLGERGSFSELAAIEYFGTGEKTISCPDFDMVFKTVAKGKTEYGIVPIENSLAGSIHQNYDLLLENKLCIVGELFLQISHYLISNKGVTLRKIKTVYSHPQALAQCKKYLRRFRKISVVPVSNTAIGVKKVYEEKLQDAAAIASMQAAIDYDMHIVAENIEDNPHNTTRFLVLSKNHGKQRSDPEQRMKTSVVFSMKNIPGALFKSLSVFALRDIDLYKIESRPVHGKGFEYLFYLDFAGDADDGAQKNALNHLREITTFYRKLGSYPVGRFVNPECRKRIP